MSPPPSTRKPLLSPPVIAAIVYVLAAVALWLWYPRSQRAVINGGPSDQFAGFSPDGKSLVVYYHPQGIRLWNLADGRPGTVFKADDQKMWEPSFAFSADGKRLSVCRSTGGGEHYSDGRDYFNVETGEKLTTVKLPPTWKMFVCESPDGLLVACGGYESTQVYEIATGDVRYQVVGGSAGAFSADGKTLAVATTTEPRGRWTIQLFDPNTGNAKGQFAEGDRYVNHLLFSPQGDKLALGVWQDVEGPSDVRGIQLWDVATRTLEQMLPLGHDDAVNLGRLKFVADGKVISATGSYRSFAWDLSAAAPNHLVGSTALSPFPTVLSPAGRLAAVNDLQAKLITVRRLGTGKEEIVGRYSYVYDATPVAITPDERLIVSVNPAGQWLRRTLAKVFPTLGMRYDVVDIASGRRIGCVPLKAGAGPLAVSPDGKTLVTQRYTQIPTDRFTFWDVPTATPWLAILGFAILPAAIVYWLLRSRQTATPAPT